MIRQIRESVARRRGVELESGFTLIELLIVIVVLGILAATVIFALTGITGQSTTAACQSDAKTYEVAVAAFENSPSNSSNNAPTSTDDLLHGAGGPFLHQAANNSAYVVALAGDTGPVNNATSVTIPDAKPTAGATLDAGTVVVGSSKSGTLVSYDDETSATGCNGL
jgi:general secretion pathway protein G